MRAATAAIITLLSAAGKVCALEPLSYFPSTVPGISIRNFHIVASNPDGGIVLRGGSPETLNQCLEVRNFSQYAQVPDLPQYDVDSLLLFESNDGLGVKHELKDWSAAGFTEDQIHHVTLDWHKVDSFQTVCQETAQGLQLLKTAYLTPGKGIFFHCVVGEDRTGYLAGLFRMLLGQEGVKDAFTNDLCEWGYEEADPIKPRYFGRMVRRVITPSFLKMAYLIESGQLTFDNLGDAACANDPANDPKFTQDPTYNDSEFYKCRSEGPIPRWLY